VSRDPEQAKLARLRVIAEIHGLTRTGTDSLTSDTVARIWELCIRLHDQMTEVQSGLPTIPFDQVEVLKQQLEVCPLNPSIDFQKIGEEARKEGRRLRDLARIVLGVELDGDLATAEYFATEYGWSPDQYGNLSYRQIFALIEQRIRREQGKQSLATEPCWISASKAAELSESTVIGFPLTLDRISKLADKVPPPFAIRRPRRGKVKLEVDRQGFLGYCIQQKIDQDADKQDEKPIKGEPDKEEEKGIQQRLEAERANKQNRRHGLD
jgi:hypothetical protein